MGHTEVVQLLLKNGADINDIGASQDRDNCSCADMTALGNYHWTPLHMASFKGNTEIAKLLLERGASVNVKGARQGRGN
jgi:ankyrin repeat protein